MEVIHMQEVDDFINSLQVITREAVQEAINLLGRDGFRLSMPMAKPVGDGLWELRIRTHPRVRILYGFCHGIPILLVAFIKQKSAIPRERFERAKRIFREVCI
jgi:hypothetical protein